MKFIRYGIVLEWLKERDIEMVRQHRNSPLITQTMEFRDYITPEMQLAWYRSVDNFNNFYLLIEYEGHKIGLLNAKNIDWEKQELESGIFLWDTKYYETFVPAIVSVMLTDLCFRLFNWQTIHAHILRTNHRAISYNKLMGYQLAEGQDDVENQEYILTPESFDKATARLRRSFQKLFPGEGMIRLLIEPDDIAKGHAPRLEEMAYASSLVIDSVTETVEGKLFTFLDPAL